VNTAPIRKELLEILACPACSDRPKVELRDDGLHCPKCGRVYPVENGVPIMLVEKASGG
jgi:uncharacterized protein YbaR (Trm112 family)